MRRLWLLPVMTVAVSAYTLCAAGDGLTRIATPTWSAYYPFEQIAAETPDIAEPVAHGAQRHPAQCSGIESVEGVSGRAARLQGRSYMAVPDFPGGAGFTVAVWIRTTHDDYQYVLAKGNNVSGSFYLRLEKGGLPRAAFLPIADMTVAVESRAPVNDGQWHHLAAVMDGQDLILYVDGRRAAVCALGIPAGARLPAYRSLTYIGAFDAAENDGPPDAYFFQGDLDELRLMDCGVTPETVAEWAVRKQQG